MTCTRLQRRTIAAIALAFGLLAAEASSVVASSASERQQERQGAQIASEVAAGKLARAHLTRSQYELVGEYAMGRALGSTLAHEQADSLWEQMMGSGGAEAMHVYLGERYIGGGVAPEGRYGSLYGWMGAMMGAYGGPSLADRMSSYLRDHEGGVGGDNRMGPGMMYGEGARTYETAGGPGGGWPSWATVALVALATVLIGGVLALAVPRLRRRGKDSTSPAGRHSGSP